MIPLRFLKTWSDRNPLAGLPMTTPSVRRKRRLPAVTGEYPITPMR